MSPTPLDGSPGPTEHIRWTELAARLDPAKAAQTLVTLQRTPALWPSAIRLANTLEAIRVIGGNAPVRVTCGLRPGDPRQHGAMQAADIQIAGVSPIQLAQAIRAAALPGVRQVLAETDGARALLLRPMGSVSGWVHVACFGADGEPFRDPSSMPWGVAWKESGERRYAALAP